MVLHVLGGAGLVDGGDGVGVKYKMCFYVFKRFLRLKEGEEVNF